MKKIILIFIYCFMINTMVVAATVTSDKCNGDAGIIIVSDDGRRYCEGEYFRTKNWWSARLWCRKMGSDLVDIQKDCGCLIENCVTCPNLFVKSSSSHYWAKNSYPNGKAAALIHGRSSIAKVDKKTTYVPICPMQ